MDNRAWPGELAASPQAVAAAERVKAEQGFDPLDEDTLRQAVTGYRRLMRKAYWWAMISVWPVIFVMVMIIVSVPGHGQGVQPAALALAAVGAIIAAFPLSKSIRAYRDMGHALRVIRGYQNVLRATQPDPGAVTPRYGTGGGPRGCADLSQRHPGPGPPQAWNPRSSPRQDEQQLR